MAKLKTQLLVPSNSTSQNKIWHDNLTSNQNWVDVWFNVPDNFAQRTEYNHDTHAQTSQVAAVSISNGILTFADGDTLEVATGIYTFAEGQPNRFQTSTIVEGEAIKAKYLDEQGVEKLITLLTKVVGNSGQIVVDESVEGQVTLKFADELTFNNLNVTGNSTIGGDLTVEGNVNGGSAEFTGEVSGAEGNFTGQVSGSKGSFTGEVSGSTGNFTGKVSGEFLGLKVYPAGQTPPTPTQGNAAMFITKRSA